MKTNLLKWGAFILMLTGLMIAGACSSSQSDSESDVLPDDSMASSEGSGDELADAVPELAPPGEGSDSDLDASMSSDAELAGDGTAPMATPEGTSDPLLDAATTDGSMSTETAATTATSEAAAMTETSSLPEASTTLADATTTAVAPVDSEFSKIVKTSKSKRRKKKKEPASENQAQNQDSAEGFAAGSLSDGSQPPHDGVGYAGMEAGLPPADLSPQMNAAADPAAMAGALPDTTAQQPVPSLQQQVAPPQTLAMNTATGRSQSTIGDPNSPNSEDEVPFYRNKWVLGAGVVLLSGFGFMLMSRLKSA